MDKIIHMADPAARATEIVQDVIEGRMDEARPSFNEQVLAAFTDEVREAGLATVAGLVGAFEGFGTDDPFVRMSSRQGGRRVYMCELIAPYVAFASVSPVKPGIVAGVARPLPLCVAMARATARTMRPTAETDLDFIAVPPPFVCRI